MSRVHWRKGALSAAIASTMALIFCTSSLFISTFALFLKPVSNELHWNPAIFPQSLLIVSVIYAITAPIAGRAADRLGPVRIVVLGDLIFALGLFGLSRMGGSLTTMYLFAVLLGIAAPLVNPATIAPVVARWFDEGRGLMMGLILGAAPQIAAAAFSPIIAQVIQHLGWRTSYQILGLSVLVIAIPYTLLFLKNPSDSEASPVGGASRQMPLPGLTLKEAIRGRPFWLMLSVSATLALVYGGVSGHLVAWQSDHGLPAAFCAEALSAMFIGAVAGPIVAGVFADRIQRPQVLLPFLAAPLLGLVLLITRGNPWLTIAGSALVGFGFSAWVGQTSLLVTRYYGLRSIGELSGVLISSGGISLGIGPVVVGVARTLMGSYDQVMVLCLVVLIVPPVCVLALPLYPAASWTSGEVPQAVPSTVES
jgi:MFS family permease